LHLARHTRHLLLLLDDRVVVFNPSLVCLHLASMVIPLFLLLNFKFSNNLSSLYGASDLSLCVFTSVYVVLKESHIETSDSDSIPPGIKDSRKKAPIDENGILQEDVLFRSPSYAAALVVGAHANGLNGKQKME
jgi:hypothetical protein